MPFIAVEIVIILMLLLLNGFFALAEMAIVSSRKARLRAWADEGSQGAQVALALAESPNIFLSTVQAGVTLVSVLAGAIGSATLAARLAGVLAGVPALAPYSRTISVIVVVALVTYFTLIIGELVPKRLALTNPERVAVRVARTMRAITRAMAPVVHLLDASSGLVIRLLRRPIPTRPPVTDEEVRLIIEEGIGAGVFEEEEKEIVDRLFRLSDRRVNAIMTPRAEIIWLDIHASREEILRTLIGHPFTVYPLGDGDIDNVVGIVFARDIIFNLVTNSPLKLLEMAKKSLIFHEGYSALRAIDKLRQSGLHVAVIIDEYGGTAGILTLTDIVESLVGEIPSREGPDIVRRDDGSYSVDGFLPLDELKILLDIDVLPNENTGYQTLAGFIMNFLGKVPRVGDTFHWANYDFEVVDMDANRIDRVLITPRESFIE